LGIVHIVGYHANEKEASPDGSPINYIHHSVPFTDLTALYRIADICLVTSHRDGMNLVAAEYVACQKDRYGVLVLSELAGAAAFMGEGSITFNPSSAQQLTDSIYKAATMNREEKKEMYEKLAEFVFTNTRYVCLLLIGCDLVMGVRLTMV
jgi:trehalose 6-phosphate synthase